MPCLYLNEGSQIIIVSVIWWYHYSLQLILVQDAVVFCYIQSISNWSLLVFLLDCRIFSFSHPLSIQSLCLEQMIWWLNSSQATSNYMYSPPYPSYFLISSLSLLLYLYIQSSTLVLCFCSWRSSSLLSLSLSLSQILIVNSVSCYLSTAGCTTFLFLL